MTLLIVIAAVLCGALVVLTIQISAKHKVASSVPLSMALLGFGVGQLAVGTLLLSSGFASAVASLCVVFELWLAATVYAIVRRVVSRRAPSHDRSGSCPASRIPVDPQQRRLRVFPPPSLRSPAAASRTGRNRPQEPRERYRRRRRYRGAGGVHPSDRRGCTRAAHRHEG